MKERPIIFSGPMVRAILDGRKTMTRRIIKLYPSIDGKRFAVYPPEEIVEIVPEEFQQGVCHYLSTAGLSGPYKLPYAVGDRLWVRETWAPRLGNDGEDDPRPRYVKYRADSGAASPHDEMDWHSWPDKWRSPRYMPRWASRITLEVTGVKVERLQEISEEDAQAEGIRFTMNRDPWATGPDACRWACEVDSRRAWNSAKAAFEELWNSLHGAGAWDQNPWVVAISFVCPAWR